MTTPVSKNDISNPTLSLKSSDISDSSDIKLVEVNDFKGYVQTGIKVEIKTPLIKNSRNALFAINTDGFIPPYNIQDADDRLRWSNVMRNMFPIQSFSNSLDTITIIYEPIALPVMHMYLSHRFISGSIGIGMRISSNTGQSGNLILTQAVGIQRDYYYSEEKYTGLKFLNSSKSTSDYQVGNFALVDLSLNRSVSIVAGRNDPNKVTDLAQKIHMISSELSQVVSLKDSKTENVISSQFLEDWIFVGVLGDLPNFNSNKVTIDFFFDFSRVQFLVPMYIIIPSTPTQMAHQIMNFSTTFKNLPTIRKVDIKWLPLV